ncbi:MAG: hypothetical protein JXC31_05725 [Acholeplasmataceae bacterium]|nr:hypothetical protein [Acholeplasmataceae bacterium]
MKKFSLLFLISTIMMLTPFFNVRADMGPKSSIEVDIIGVEDHYVIDLLYPGILPSQNEIDQLLGEIDSDWILGGQNIPEILWNINDSGFIVNF